MRFLIKHLACPPCPPCPSQRLELSLHFPIGFSYIFIFLKKDKEDMLGE
jgi:hypothetical protein